MLNETHTDALFDWGDYTVFSLLLLVSVLIGVYFGCFGNRQKTPKDYLLGGKTMKVLPVGLSLVASSISGTSLIGVAAEVYTEGALYILMVPSLFFACMVVSVVFLPVFCNLNITSAYEYLELRFNRSARTYASLLYLLNAFLFLPMTVYIPSICLNQVTGLNLYLIAFTLTFVCVFYTTIGGLKAVVWTDFFQTVVIIAACLAIVVIGTYNVGGWSYVLDAAYDAGRLDILKLDINPFQRNTFWTVLIGTFFNWGSFLVSNQANVQRFISVPTASDAQKCLLVYWIGTSFLTAISIYGGLLIYAAYLGCDPIEQKLVQKADQMYPYYVMDKIGYVPILPGLFIAGIFSAALSTLSTSLNAIAATLYEDYIKRKNYSDQVSNIIMKVTIVIMGSVTICMVLLVEKLGNIIAVSYTIGGVTSGPIFAMFLMGMTVPFANYKGALAGSVVSFVVMAWISVGAAMHKVNHASKNLYAHIPNTCPDLNATFAENMHLNSTQREEEEIFFVYKLSYMMFKTLGITIAFVVSFIVSYITGPQDVSKLDPKLICPPLRRFLPKNNEKEMDVLDKLVVPKFTETDK